MNTGKVIRFIDGKINYFCNLLCQPAVNLYLHAVPEVETFPHPTALPHAPARLPATALLPACTIINI